MSLVTTLAKKGHQAKVFDIPDEELSKYQPLEGTKTTYADGKDQLVNAEELAGGVQLDKADVEAYGDLCICWWKTPDGRVYFFYRNCWQSCP